ncbi:MAG TPA: hypothetical protein VMT74_13690 [Gaiellaceae bacterium]|nr:hypothetical protein [Gaiellaceae bacterium]
MHTGRNVQLRLAANVASVTAGRTAAYAAMPPISQSSPLVAAAPAACTVAYRHAEPVRLAERGGLERVASRRRLVDVEALVAERRRDGVDDRGLVVHDQDPVGHTGSLPPVPVNGLRNEPHRPGGMMPPRAGMP